MTNDQSPVRIGIVGCGNVLSAYLGLAERLRRKGLADVVVLCGRKHQKDTAQSGWPSAEFITDFTEMVSREDVDAVVILTPMREHARMVRMALRSGKHVLVEKPMATHLDEARELVELAKQSRGHLVCAPFTVLSPTFEAITRRLRGGEIGRVVSARARYGWAGPDWSSWFYQAEGGALFDLGVYLITTLTGWLGPVRRVMAMSGITQPVRTARGQSVKVEAEDNTQVLLDFGGNCFAAVTTGFTIQQYRGPGIELFGTEGTINLLGDDWDPDGYELWQNAAGCWQFYKEAQPDWPWTDGLRHLVDCIHQRKRPIVTPEHACHVLEVMVQAQASGRDGQARAIDSTFDPPAFDEDEITPMAAHRVHDRTRSE